jgi:hypothetical protein
MHFFIGKDMNFCGALSAFHPHPKKLVWLFGYGVVYKMMGYCHITPKKYVYQNGIMCCVWSVNHSTKCHTLDRLVAHLLKKVFGCGSTIPIWCWWHFFPHEKSKKGANSHQG